MKRDVSGILQRGSRGTIAYVSKSETPCSLKIQFDLYPNQHDLHTDFTSTLVEEITLHDVQCLSPTGVVSFSHPIWDIDIVVERGYT